MLDSGRRRTPDRAAGRTINGLVAHLKGEPVGARLNGQFCPKQGTFALSQEPEKGWMTPYSDIHSFSIARVRLYKNAMTHSNPMEDPGIRSAIFYPRPDMPYFPEPQGAKDHLHEVAPDIALRLRVFPGPDAAPTILFFHGNGETGRDYDAVAPAFSALPVTFMVAEYRGYGPSGGVPTLTTFLDDAHRTLDEVQAILQKESRNPSVVVMGRSLGSAPAIDLAASRSRDLSGLIVESGFALIVPLLELLGIPAADLGITEAHGPRNGDKIAGVTLPTLIIHAEQDEIISITDGEALHHASADPSKRFLRVPGAGHNDIQLAAGVDYFQAIRELLGRLEDAAS